MQLKITKRAVDVVAPKDRDEILWDSEVPGFGLRARAKGGKFYVVKYRAGNRQRWMTIGRHGSPWTPEQARREAKRILGEVAGGKDPAASRAEARTVAKAEPDTFEKTAWHFIERYAKKNGRRSAPETERIFRVYVNPVIGKRPIADVRRREIIELLDKIADERGPIMANRTLAVVRKMFNWAAARDIVQASPVVGVQRPGAERRGTRILSDHEMRKIWEAAATLGFPFGPLIQLLLVTGQRRNEVAGMRRSEIDEPNAVWTIPAVRTKNGLAHEVPLSGLAGEILAALPVLGDCVFASGRAGDRPVSGFSKCKRALDASSGTFSEPWTLHDLRRTFRTRLSGLSVSSDVAEKVVNHVPKDVRHVYDLHRYREEKRAALEAWVVRLRGILEGPIPTVVELRRQVQEVSQNRAVARLPFLFQGPDQ